MRFAFASAAIIIAAAVPMMSTNGQEIDCQDCLKAVLQVPAAINPIVDVAVGMSPKDLADGGTSVAAIPEENADQPQATAEAEASAPDLCATLIDAAEANELPPAFLARLIWRESRFNPTTRSPAGA